MYTRIESKFWTDEKFKPAEDIVKLGYLYCLSSPHKNIIGMYFLPLGYVSSDLHWTIEKVQSVFDELIRMKRIIYDPDSCVLLVLNYFKHNPIQNKNMAISGIDKLSELPENSCLEEFEKAIKKYYKPFVLPLLKRLRERLGKQVTVEETETVTGEVTVTTPEKYFKDHVNPAPSLIVFDEIKYYIEIGVEDLLIIRAMDIALAKGKNNWGYMNGIIQNWVNSKILTLQQYEQAQKQAGQQSNQAKKDKLDKIREELEGKGNDEQ